MSQSKTPAGPTQLGANLAISGGAAIVAPVGAFQGGIPPNALIVLPVKKPTDDLEQKLRQGPLVVTPDQMWELLGLNGAPVQVQDQEGRPLTIGLNDLLGGLEKHWKENPADLNRGRLYAQELMRHGRAEQAEKVMAKIVASGGTGEDWLGLGVAQLAAGNLDKAESTLKGAQNLYAQSPFPALNLAKVYDRQERHAEARTMVEKALSTDSTCIEAWVYLYNSVREREDEDAAIRGVEELAQATMHASSAAPYIALQGLYAGEEATRPKALEFAKKAIERDPNDSLALVSLSALYGQAGDLNSAIELLERHESKMLRDVRLANNYFEALLQARQMEKLTKLLNALASSPQREVKQFAVERSRFVAQLLQQQRARAGTDKAASPT